MRDRDGRSSLHLALAAGRENIVQSLLEAGADATAPTDGKPPLHIARSVTVVRMLLDAGASALGTSEGGETARESWTPRESWTSWTHSPQVAAML